MRQSQTQLPNRSRAAGRALVNGHWPLAGRGRRAVTFMELMVVILILMLMMGIAIPTMAGVHRRGQLAAAAREVAALARLARSKAVLLGHATELHVNADEGTYQLLLNPPDPRGRVRMSAEPPRTSIEQKRSLGEGTARVRFVSADSGAERARMSEATKIVFYRNGTATPATVVLTDKADRLMTVQIVGATGDVRIGEGPPEALAIPVVAYEGGPPPAEAAPPAGVEAGQAPDPAGGGPRIKRRGE